MVVDTNTVQTNAAGSTDLNNLLLTWLIDMETLREQLTFQEAKSMLLMARGAL